MRNRPLTTLAAVIASAGLVLAGSGATAASDTDRLLLKYATDTWESFDAMVDEDMGLPADNIEGNLDEDSRSGYTSPTNIGAYMWSTVVARDLKIIDRKDARDRLAQTIETVAGLERHDESGMFYNWYDEATGVKLTTWPGTGDTVYPFLSSVDNGWLAVALIVAGNAEPRVRAAADAILDTMDFGFHFDPVEMKMRGGFWDETPPGCAVTDNYRDGETDVYYTCHHYGTLNSESRIATYLAMAFDQVPDEAYFHLYRTLPQTCDWSWHEMRPEGEWNTYMGVDVFNGTYEYRGMDLVPSWGGSMFEALMPDLFLFEAKWAPEAWGENHPLFVQSQIEHGLDEADYGYWGFSPASNPYGGYREFGVEQLGMDTNGYASDVDWTSVESGWDDPACFRAAVEPEEFNDGVVTPHAVFLALPYAEDAALENLANLRKDFKIYGPGGFYDAVAVRSGMVAKRYLSLDQGMIMAQLGNELKSDMMRKYATRGELKDIRHVIGLEDFGTSG